jgi:exodeoxyribonuclease V alpha subunit
LVRFDQREVAYDCGGLDEVALAYAITIHKSHGSEFPVVVIPLATQHYLLLQRNLVYTGITRGKKLVVLICQRKAMAMAVRNNKTENRFSGLLARLGHVVNSDSRGQGTWSARHSGCWPGRSSDKR